MMNHYEQDELTRLIERALSPLVIAEGGRMDVVSEPDDLFEVLSNSPRGWRLVMGWDGYAPHEEANLSAIYDRYYFIVQIGQGLQVRPGAPVYRERPGAAKNLMTLIGLTDGWVRGLRFPTGGVEGGGFQGDGGDWVELETESKKQTSQFRLDYRLPRLLPNTAEIANGQIIIGREEEAA